MENLKPSPICAVYARVSTDMQEESIEHQISKMKEYIKEKNLGITPDEYIYEDVVSATKYSMLQRPAMKRLLDDAKKGRIQIVIFKEISRFARNVQESLAVLDMLRQYGIRVFSYTENYDSSKTDSDLVFTIQSAFAEEEAKKIAIRTRLGKKEKARQGLWASGTPPYGYMIQDRKLIPHPEEAEIVKKIFHMYVNEGKGSTQIGQWLVDHDVPSRQGVKFWQRANINRILKNQVYIGRNVYNKQKRHKITDYETNTKKLTYLKNKEEDWVIVENAHEPIIDESTFRRTQEILSRRAKRLEGRNTVHPLSGITKCKNCGENMVITHSKSKIEGNPRYRYYCCRIYKEFGRKYCPQKIVNAYDLEDYVISRLIERLRKVSEDDRFYDCLKIPGQKENLEKELNKVTTKIEKLSREAYKLRIERDEMNEHLYNHMMQAINEDINKLVEKKRNIELEISNQERMEDKLDQFKKYTESILSPGIKNDLPKLKMLLQYFIDRIEVEGTHIHIHYKFPI